jgi:hypothetical protein
MQGETQNLDSECFLLGAESGKRWHVCGEESLEVCRSLKNHEAPMNLFDYSCAVRKAQSGIDALWPVTPAFVPCKSSMQVLLAWFCTCTTTWWCWRVVKRWNVPDWCKIYT